mmetsp:Transcript_17663/g.43008  ORF Transcript_17663/g.43008 Transcript_17663/m.43008 type:complete len:801 (+) Transcript_17663:296-2698(+)
MVVPLTGARKALNQRRHDQKQQQHLDHHHHCHHSAASNSSNSLSPATTPTSKQEKKTTRIIVDNNNNNNNTVCGATTDKTQLRLVVSTRQDFSLPASSPSPSIPILPSIEKKTKLLRTTSSSTMATETETFVAEEEEEEESEHSYQCCDEGSNRSIDSCESSVSNESNDSRKSSDSSNSESSSTSSDSDSHESVNKRTTKKKKKKASKEKDKIMQNETKSKTVKEPYCCSTAGRCVRSCAAYGRVCPLLADAAGRTAAEHISKICEGSVLFQDCCCDVNCSGKNSTTSPSTVSKKKKKKQTKKSSSKKTLGPEEDPADTSESTGCCSASATSFCSFNNSNHSTDHDDNNNTQFSCFSNVRIIEPSEIVMGEKLGEGGFCNVHSCALKKKKKKPASSNNHATETDEEGTASNHDFNPILTDETCAVKFLRREVTAHRKTFQHGAADLVSEAFFLARLGDDNGRQHPNIVELMAVAAGNVEENIRNMATRGDGFDNDEFNDENNSSTVTPTGFFIVIERLVETLEQRIKRWQARSEADQNAHSHSLFYRMSKEYKDKQKEWLKERVFVALEIANVMAYLASRGVAFRDLKPDNVGFDRHGNLKLFDLGLCKEEKPCLSCSDNDDSNATNTTTYRMTGHTGSRRYMAPEVALDKGYNKSVDVYSFGILLWEIFSMEKPFKGYCSKKHMKCVIEGGERPKIDHHLPINLQWLLKSCWSPNPEDRPSFDTARSILSDVLDELSKTKSERSRSRSTGSHDDTPISPTTRRAPTSKPLAPVFESIKMPARQGGIRVRSLGFKRGGNS